MSSAVVSSGSDWIFSSCFCSRSSSPESRAPRSRGSEASRASRSRRRSSASEGAIAVSVPLEESQQRRQLPAQLGPRHARVEVAEAEVLRGEPEVLGELLAGRLLDD